MLPPLREKIAVLMPTSRPSPSTSAPPELPGLIAASVWMKFSMVDRPSWLRSSALTMPEVTVSPTLNGLPIASTGSPTESCLMLPNGITGRLSSDTFSSARSESASVPTTLALAERPSDRVTSMSSAPSTTCWLVSR